MKTKNQLLKHFSQLIREEEKKENKDFTKILRFQRILEIRKQKFFIQEYIDFYNEFEEKRYIIVDNENFDVLGEHFNLEEVKKELYYIETDNLDMKNFFNSKK